MMRTYQASTLAKALELARVGLGNDIEIINQRFVKKPGIKGFFQNKDIEIVVASKDKLESESLKKEISDLKNIISNMQNKNIDEVKIISNKLKSLGVKDSLIEDIKEEIVNMESEDMSNNLFYYLKNKIKISSVSDTNKMILVGSPGVGKTTTIAKLAANFVFNEGKSVGVITLDTYRIGAVEQLKIYTDIMNIKFRAVLSYEDIQNAEKELSECDVILIDTTGRGYKCDLEISKLNTYLKDVKNDEIHLVLSCTTKDIDLENNINSYKKLDFKNIILTKIDETSTYGTILNIIDYSNCYISYITTGQNVPDDILIPTKDELIKIILGVEKI